MPVSTHAAAHNAPRPKGERRTKIQNEVKLGLLRIGRFKLPSEFTRKYPDGSDQALEIDQRMEQIQQLLDLFSTEKNLLGTGFTSEVKDHATELMMSHVTLKRLLLRYWYFGGVRQSTLALRTGPEPGLAQAGSKSNSAPTSEIPSGKRRGPKNRLVGEKYQDITFVPGEADFSDMVKAMARLARKGRTTWVEAHLSYLKVEFKARHRALAKSYVDNKILCPVTLRQFTRIVKEYEDLSASLRENVRALSGNRSLRALLATGPGDMYEVDATGGQIYLVDSEDRTRVLAHPTIYLMIDRWSRYIVGIYVTLGPPSAEALRMLLRVSFTSRDERFKLLGVEISDKRWPIGVVPAQMTLDRGSDMISFEMLETAVNELKIEPLALKPFTPDGKAIVERVIGTLKNKLRSKGTPGVHDKSVIGPKAGKKLKRAKEAAILTLAELYRILVELVDEYNHSPHKSLKARAELRMAGVPPTPVAAYKWGLDNLTGIQRPPLTDEDYRRMTLKLSHGTLKDRKLRYGHWRFHPVNEAARRLARRPSRKGQRHQIGTDPLFPTVVYSMDSWSGDWPIWRIEPAGQAHYARMTVEEEIGLAERQALVISQSEHDALRERVAKGSSTPFKKQSSKTSKPSGPSPASDRERKRQESLALNKALSGKNTSPRQPAGLSAARKLAYALDDQEEEMLLATATGKKGKA